MINSLADIYPNPNDGNFHIKLDDNIKYAYVEVYNSSGSVIHTSEVSESNNYFSLSDLPNGLYFMRINDTKTRKSIIKKFIIQK